MKRAQVFRWLRPGEASKENELEGIEEFSFASRTFWVASRGFLRRTVSDATTFVQELSREFQDCHSRECVVRR
jgi:hypothetical protein